MADHVKHQADPETQMADDAQDNPVPDPRVEARRRRIASLRRVAGMWAERTDIPDDGLQYERALRNE